MGRLGRIGLVLLGLLVVVVVVGTVYLYVTTRRPFPRTDGRLEVAGLQEEVRVLRDEWGVPHIYAQNEHDLFFAQGYVHAQDRFWQMEFWRHVSQGRISEIVGEPTLEQDKFIRTMGWNRMAADTVAYMEEESPEMIEILESYSAGVNAYIAANEAALSLNQTVLGLVNEPWEIEPWEPVHTLGWGVVMSFQLSGNWENELTRAALIRDLGEGTVATLVPGYPYEDRPVIAPTDLQVNDLPGAADTDGGEEEEGESDNEGLYPAGLVDWARLDLSVTGRPPDEFAFGSGPHLGSNNWVVSGEHTESGLPLLANDPHLGIQMPSIWYEAGLHAPGWEVVGFTFAGVPGVIIGHNANIAWGVTNVGPDVQDLYIERINPNNPQEYEFQGEWEEMEIIEEVIRVNGGEDVVLEIRTTRHGPIMNEVIEPQRDVLALRWTAQEPSRVLQAALLLNQAANYDDFREALRYWDVPAQNFVYADIEGNIAYQTPGRIPIRAQGDGTVSVPGWTGEYEWEGFIPFEELPALFNPPDGFIVTANNSVVDEDYPYFIARDWADGDRALRIVQMLEEAIERGGVTAGDFARIQNDSKSLRAEAYIPLLRDLSSSDPQVQAAIERLRGWDLQERRDSVPAAIFEVFYMHLVHNVLADELGEDHLEVLASDPFFYTLAGQPEAPWWDDTTTNEAETQQDMILRSLADAIEWLEEELGSDTAGWQWGNLHTATFVSDPLGQSGVGLIENIVNRGPFPADGGTDRVNANNWSWNDPAAIRSHPSMRMILDLADFDASQTVIPTGQSGHPFHPHYDDMIELWLNGEYHPMWFSEEAVAVAAEDELILVPEEN